MWNILIFLWEETDFHFPTDIGPVRGQAQAPRAYNPPRTLENRSGESVDNRTDISSSKGLSSPESPVQKSEKAGQRQ